ncbi:glycoside hydrolase family 6 protein [Sphaerisporangium fuscum]|uniref:glycoside hydrolase family 6 protein n=1 Tax=Sphaerisporangium fuscum TaxID=2835868 RepID=UPI001BDC9A22|nr:glycoside hydrolase family 6 protein [Sphaerisporangium fuscum]
MGPHKSSWRRALTGAAVTLLASVGLVAGPNSANAAVACQVTYQKAWDGGGGFGGNITIKNLGDALSNWTLTFAFPGSQKVTNGWSADWSQSGANVTAKSLSYNGSQASGASWSIGFNGSYSGSNADPTSFAINGTTCNGQGPGNGQQALVVSPTSVTVPEGGTATYNVHLAAQPTAAVTVTSAAGTGDSDITVSGGGSLTFTTSNWNTDQKVTLAAAQDADTTNGSRTINVTSAGLTGVAVTATESDDDTPGGGNPGPHVDNPYVGATGYVNSDWSSKAAAEPGGSAVANVSTGIWLDRIAAIAGTSSAKGLRAHLDAALQQDAANGSAPLTIQFVIYNLPNRDCSALASNGELKVSENGLNRYKTEYIDPIAAIMSDSKYSQLRIVTIVELDSLPNLVTNASLPACAEAKQSNAYVEGVQYALNKLHAIPNVYTYIDAAHHGWLGWDSNFGPSADLFASTVRGTTAGFNSVDGFITNTANYSALREPYFTIGTTVNGQTVRQSKWIDWNQYVDELTYAQAFRQKLVSEGFNSNIGMLIDTSRNGWGGSARPTKASTSTDVNTFVNESRVDRRIHAGNWCNQSGAGLGERPKASPETGIDAYVWIKPPGESDGSSSAIPNDEGKGFDRMCDPTYTGNDRNGNNMTGALPNAPISGAWFSAQFRELLKNAYPPLS